jgi:hypothetical protein
MARWRVDLIRKRAEHLGTVVANTEKEAIAAAIKRFEIEPARQYRIAVSKISNRRCEHRMMARPRDDDQKVLAAIKVAGSGEAGRGRAQGDREGGSRRF